MSKEVMLSGIKPTGRPHIGNYFGMMKQLIDLQNTGAYQNMFFIPDYHALNFIQNKDQLSSNIVDIVIDYLAIGFDPNKSVIFKQSDVLEHTELAWIFDTITTMAYLQRAHAFKDAQAKGNEVSVGTFNYPMLMSADILLYDTKMVPVGQDQKQHVEYARDTAEKFNRIYGENVFVMPEVKIIENVSTVLGIDGKKMSKSRSNVISLFESYDQIKKAVMSIPTDSKGVGDIKDPENDNIFRLHKLFSDSNEILELKERYEKGDIGYKESKEILIENIEKFISPFRQKREEFAFDKDYVCDLLKEGGQRAKDKASKKMEKVREVIGVKLY